MKPVEDSAAVAPARSTPRIVGRLLRAFALVALAILAVMAVVIGLMSAREGLEAMRALLSTAKPYLVALHFTLIGLLWWHWERVIGWADRISPVPESFREALLAARHRATVFLVAFELIVIVGLPSLLGGGHS